MHIPLYGRKAPAGAIQDRFFPIASKSAVQAPAIERSQNFVADRTEADLLEMIVRPPPNDLRSSKVYT
jgi:hypothetical protein